MREHIKLGNSANGDNHNMSVNIYHIRDKNITFLYNYYGSGTKVSAQGTTTYYIDDAAFTTESALNTETYKLKVVFTPANTTAYS